jgi:hypothetical protein
MIVKDVLMPTPLLDLSEGATYTALSVTSVNGRQSDILGCTTGRIGSGWKISTRTSIGTPSRNVAGR